ncbi:MAG: hypothetical protein GXP45_00360 [bacterium]|nr:hypothetical protein [bacterium]
MLPVGNKPVIQYTLESLVRAGIEDILVINSRYKKILEDYYNKNYEMKQKFITADTRGLLDDVGSLLVVNGNTIYAPDAFEEMVDLHQKTRDLVWLVAKVSPENVYKSDIMKVEN